MVTVHRGQHSWRVALRCVAFLAVVVTAPSCKPEFDERSSQVVGTRILAVQSDPAEARPDTTINYRALTVDQAGPRPELSIDWAYCTVPRPANELNDTTRACFDESGPQIVPLGGGVSQLSGQLPASACKQFGPDLPEVAQGEPVRRPADPDATGGYYQPLRLLVNLGSQYLFTLAETRILCNLPGATGDVLSTYAKEYRANTNPALSSVVAFTKTRPDGAPLSAIEVASGDDNPPLPVFPGERIRLRAGWPECPGASVCGDGVCTWDESKDTCPVDCTKPVGCAGPESYVSFDLASRALVNRRESLRLSWYANGGEFRDDRTGSAEEEFSVVSTENDWTAPSSVGLVYMWLVLRDSRGGTSWATFRISIQG